MFNGYRQRNQSVARQRPLVSLTYAINTFGDLVAYFGSFKSHSRRIESFLLQIWRAMSTNAMKALRFSGFGPPSVLRIEEVAIPLPGEGETLVRVKAAGINPSDIVNVVGRFKNTTLPRTPGRDFAGTVVKGNHHEGKEVWGSGPKLGITHDGSHAEYVVVPTETLSLKPKSLSMAQAASIGVPYITAWASVVSAAQIQAGETILIVGAAGAVGQAATQIANWKLARVIGADTSSDPIPGSESVICRVRYRGWRNVRTGAAITQIWGAPSGNLKQGRSARQLRPHRLLSQFLPTAWRRQLRIDVAAGRENRERTLLWF